MYNLLKKIEAEKPDSRIYHISYGRYGSIINEKFDKYWP
jgi:hypothetical protein